MSRQAFSVRRFTPLVLALAIALLLSPLSAVGKPSGGAAAARKKGRTAKQILKQAWDKNAFGFEEGAVARILLDIRNKLKEGRQRTISVKSKKKPKVTRVLVRFLMPKRVKGFGFLSVQRKGQEDRQYMYMPVRGRVMEVASNDRSASFFGTTFSYSDLESRNLDDATHSFLADGKIGRHPCYVIRSVTKPGKRSQYARSVSWIRKRDLMLLRARMYDRSGNLHKTLYVRRIRKIQGRRVVMESKMKNNKTGRYTLMKVVQIRFTADIPDGDLTRRALKRAI